MSLLHAIILGFTEGFSEFLPISSSGHLLIVRDLFHMPLAGSLTFDAVLQGATTLAVLIYFAPDIVSLCVAGLRFISGKEVSKRDKMYMLAIIVGTIPAIVFGLLLEKTMDTVFRNVHLVAYALIAGSALMWYADRLGAENRKIREITAGKGFVIGLFQTLAIIPGVSRSGSTISGGLFAGLSREEATKFSFLLSVPILLGSGVKKLMEVDFGASTGILWPLLAGSVTAFVVGIISIHFFIKYLKHHDFKVFVWYRVFIAILILALL